MEYIFAILASLTIASAIGAVSLRNLVHCALLLAMTFAGLAALFLQLGAQFVGLAQILVYVGAVAILIVFAILLTRNVDLVQPPILSPSWGAGLVVALLVFAVLTTAILRTTVARPMPDRRVESTVEQIGNALMTDYILPLEVIGVLLTAAMVGAVLIALPQPGGKK
jgi:NADH:ubiquinone oxidoreductase subunit 6 (subunit J)